MKAAVTTDLAMSIIGALRRDEAALRRAGILHLAVFGSVARGDAEPESDIDLVAAVDPASGMDLIQLAGLERRLGESLGRAVEILVEPVESPRLRAHVERDRLIAF